MGTTFPVGSSLTPCDSMTGLNNQFCQGAIASKIGNQAAEL